MSCRAVEGGFPTQAHRPLGRAPMLLPLSAPPLPLQQGHVRQAGARRDAQRPQRPRHPADGGLVRRAPARQAHPAAHRRRRQPAQGRRGRSHCQKLHREPGGWGAGPCALAVLTLGPTAGWLPEQGDLAWPARQPVARTARWHAASISRLSPSHPHTHPPTHAHAHIPPTVPQAIQEYARMREDVPELADMVSAGLATAAEEGAGGRWGFRKLGPPWGPVGSARIGAAWPLALRASRVPKPGRLPGAALHGVSLPPWPEPARPTLPPAPTQPRVPAAGRRSGGCTRTTARCRR